MKTHKRKILVVDDNLEFVDLVRRLLESKGFQVSIATNGKTAIEKALSDNPELALLDLKLPDIAGEAVLERMKEINKDLSLIHI